MWGARMAVLALHYPLSARELGENPPPCRGRSAQDGAGPFTPPAFRLPEPFRPGWRRSLRASMTFFVPDTGGDRVSHRSGGTW